MSWFSNLFTSPRERAAPGLLKGQMDQYGNLLSSARNLTNPFAGINAGNVYQKYGVTPFSTQTYNNQVQQTYQPMYQNLATSLAKNRSAAAARSSSNASPEATFAPIDASYTEALGNLGSSEANQELQGQQLQMGQQQFMAQLLQSALQGQNQFQTNQLGLESNILGEEGQATQNYLNSLSDTSTFGDIMSALGPIAQIAAIPATGGGSLGGSALSWFKNLLGGGNNPPAPGATKGSYIPTGQFNYKGMTGTNLPYFIPAGG